MGYILFVLINNNKILIKTVELHITTHRFAVTCPALWKPLYQKHPKIRSCTISLLFGIQTRLTMHSWSYS